MKGNHSEIYQTFLDRMESFNSKESDYHLPVHFVRNTALILLWHGIDGQQESLIKGAVWLLGELANNHPETREIIEDYLDAIGTI
jgi:hypothetical protein